MQNAACYCTEEEEEAVGGGYPRNTLSFPRAPAPPGPGPGPPTRAELPAIITEGDLYRNMQPAQVFISSIPLKYRSLIINEQFLFSHCK